MTGRYHPWSTVRFSERGIFARRRGRRRDRPRCARRNAAGVPSRQAPLIGAGFSRQASPAARGRDRYGRRGARQESL